MKRHRFFRAIWWLSNLLLAAAIIATVCTSVWEFSVRRYLKGFSDAVVPETANAQMKAEAILAWMRTGPPRLEVQALTDISPRDPQDTLNYRQLLEVCGGATNAFLNLSRSAGLEVRRLLLLAPDRTTKHVVAEVFIDGRWVIADATYRTFLKDRNGRLLTRKELQNPMVFREATSLIPNYRPEYSYEQLANVRTAAIPYAGAVGKFLLDRAFQTGISIRIGACYWSGAPFCISFCRLTRWSRFFWRVWRSPGWPTNISSHLASTCGPT